MVNEKQHRNKPDRQYNQLNTQVENNCGGGSERNARSVVADRLKEAGLPTDRFIDVKEGQKQSYDHTEREPDTVVGNYGVYSGRGLIGFDIDDYQDGVDTSALETLPPTFTVKTPHGGEHWYYKGKQRAAATIGSATGGAKNVSLSWGEIYAGGKYLVGPGSRITNCNKSHCRACRHHGGVYSIEDDRPIVEVAPEPILSVLTTEPQFADSSPQTSLEMYGEEKEGNHTGWISENQNLSSPSQKILAIEDPNSRLWQSILRHHEHNDVETGVKLVRILDRAEELGLNQWRASEQIMRWIKTDRLKRSNAPNRIAPGWADLPGGDSRLEGEQRGLGSFQ